MKVGIDARLYYESGVGRYIKNTIRELDEYCLKNKSKYSFYIFLSKKGFEEVKFQSHNIRKIRADISWHSIREQLFFGRLIDSFNLDIMHFTYFSLPIFYKKKFVVTIHDLIINHVDTGKATTLPKPVYFLKRLAYRKVIKHALLKSSYIISPSNSTKNEILKLYKVPSEKIAVIPEGVDPVFLKEVRKNDFPIPRKFILYVGNAYPHKNLERLISAYKSIEGKVDEHLVLVGRDDYFYKSLRRKLRNNSKIHIYDNVDDNALSFLYSKASFLVVPSLMEGFGLTPLEAMARNCLPVVSDIDAFSEVCKNSALYFNPKETNDIANTLIKAVSLTDEEKNKYRNSFKKRLDEFSWQKSFEGTLKVYENCNSLRQGK